ncbi:unnamed protein product, partial [Rotaria sp. Silwood2]
MQRLIYAIFNVLSVYVHYTFLSSSEKSLFQFTEEARAALCPFVGTEGMRCFDGSPAKPSGRTFGSAYMKLPRGVGISVDRSSGRLMAPAIELTYSSQGSRIWTDGHTGAMFDMFNEAILGPANGVVAAYDIASVQIFRNASQLNAAWRQTFADVSLRGSSVDIHPNARWSHNGITVAGGNGAGSGNHQLQYPLGLFFDDDQQIVYVADHTNHRVIEWKCDAANGRVVAGGNGAGSGTHQLHNPHDVIVDKETNNLLISEYSNKRVVRWSRQNGTRGEILISNIGCVSLTMDDNGFLYVVDYDKHEVRRYRRGESQGTIVAGGNGQGNLLNQLSYPHYVFVDRDHSVYVSDNGNHRVMKWVKGAKQGIVVAGNQGQGSSLSQLNGPRGLVVDQRGAVYVVDQYNHRIMRWTKEASQGSIIIGGNGAGAQSNQLYYPFGLSFD